MVQSLSTEGRLLFATRALRLFGYGAVSVVLVLYLTELDMSGSQVGILLSLTLVGDTFMSLWMATYADYIGRRRMLLLGALLAVVAGLLFASTGNFLLLLLAATIGIISPSGNEVGPFLSIEQAALSQIIPDERRTSIFAWYNLAGSFATAAGAFASGALCQALEALGVSALQSYRVVMVGYALVGALLAFLFTRLSSAVEVSGAEAKSRGTEEIRRRFGLHHSKRVVFKLSALFSLDAFAGGFILQSIVAYWFQLRYGVEPVLLGAIFFAANILAGLSSLFAVRIASRIGLVRTMVFTHIPSNVLLILVPLMPSLGLAIFVLLLRFSISQMDVPTRQSYTMAVVRPEERSAAAGVTGTARTIGASLSPIFTGPLLANAALASVPFFVSGGLKIIYDLLLYRSFKALMPPEEVR